MKCRLDAMMGHGERKVYRSMYLLMVRLSACDDLETSGSCFLFRAIGQSYLKVFGI